LLETSAQNGFLFTSCIAGRQCNIAPRNLFSHNKSTIVYWYYGCFNTDVILVDNIQNKVWMSKKRSVLFYQTCTWRFNLQQGEMSYFTKPALEDSIFNRERCLILPNLHLKIQSSTGRDVLFYQTCTWRFNFQQGEMFYFTKPALEDSIFNRGRCFILPNLHLKIQSSTGGGGLGSH
jgi:hypothetical protein